MARTLRILTALPETGEVPDPTGQGRRRTGNTGRVELTALPEWMKGSTTVAALMTPDEARALAIALMLAAQRAEGKRVTLV